MITTQSQAGVLILTLIGGIHAPIFGCAAPERVEPGVKEGHLFRLWGAPDYKLEIAGDEGRYARFGDQFEYKWRVDQTTYYYLERDRAVTLEKGRITSIDAVRESDRALFPKLPVRHD